MGLLGMFRGKNNGDVEEGSMGPGMVNMLAGMPGMMRKQMVKGRISQLLTLSEDKRQETILGMFASFHDKGVKESNREKVIATRIEVIGELPEDKRRTIMASRIAAMKQRPDLDTTDKEVSEKVFHTVPAKVGKAFMESWDAVEKESQS